MLLHAVAFTLSLNIPPSISLGLDQTKMSIFNNTWLSLLISPFRSEHRLWRVHCTFVSKLEEFHLEKAVRKKINTWKMGCSAYIVRYLLHGSCKGWVKGIPLDVPFTPLSFVWQRTSCQNRTPELFTPWFQHRVWQGALVREQRLSGMRPNYCLSPTPSLWCCRKSK